MSDGTFPGTRDLADETFRQVMDELRGTVRLRCAMPDFATSGECKWPMKSVGYVQTLALPGLSSQQIADAYGQAATSWNRICGINLAPVTAAKANIDAKSGRIDGASGTLAWSYLPCGASASSRMDQLYDDAERWTFDWLVEVAAHEIGHAIGLSHGPSGSLMYAYSQGGKIDKPQAWDIAEAQKRYGKPVVEPTPEPPDDLEFTGMLVGPGGKLYTLKLEPV